VREAIYIDELMEEKTAVNMKVLIRFGAPSQPACCRARLYGEDAVLLVAVKKPGSSDGAMIPAKKMRPRNMTTIRKKVFRMACSQSMVEK
jgi:hypothetical protein